MQIRPLTGLFGVLTAALTAEFNDQVTSLALPDIRGGLGISLDQGSWLTGLYATGQIFGMAFSPWFALTLSIRRWALGSIAFACLITLMIPACSNLTLLYTLRLLQGVGSGVVIPLLLVVGLRALPPPIRLFGLAGYALTATFGPNLSATLAALWTEIVGWQFVFFEALPLGAIAAVLVWYGVEQDPPNYARFARFDWRGAILITLGVGALTTMLQQGDRYDWFNSDTISVLALISLVTLPMMVINEIRAPMPFYGFFLLRRRNIAYALITLFTFLLLGLSASGVPNQFLASVAGLRPAQLYAVTLEIALLQLLMLPLMAIVLNISWVDSRIVSFVGLCCVLAACLLDAQITSVSLGGNFVLAQTLQAIGQPMIVMPLLLMATNAIRNAEEAPLASAMVNSSRGLAEPVGVWLLQLIERWRGNLHTNRLLDQAGQQRYATIQANGLIPGNPPPLLPNGMPAAPGSLEAFSRAIDLQASVLTASDIFLVIAGLTVGLMILLVLLPVRTFPPRIALAKQ